MNISRTLRAALALTLAGLTLAAFAQEATIRKVLAERLPNLPKIEEVSKTPMNGLYEVRINQSDIFYSDAKGDFVLLQGELIDTRTHANLTEARVNKLTAIAFDQLPIKDAFTTVRGNGKQKIAVFSDPNCGYCKRLERDLANLNDVTIYTFLIPILGPDSQTKARNIWCAKDKSVAYIDWMLKGSTPASASCDTAALTRNTEFANRLRITGTPTSFMADGTRVQGADFKKIEQTLAALK